MLRIGIEETQEALRLVLEGRLIGPWVDEVRRVCLEHAAPSCRMVLIVDLCGLTAMDAAGQSLLQDLFHRGATIRCSDVLNQYLVEEISRSRKAAQAACRPCRSNQAGMTAR